MLIRWDGYLYKKKYVYDTSDSTNYKLAFKEVEGNSWSTKWHIFILILWRFLRRIYKLFNLTSQFLWVLFILQDLWEGKNRLSNYKEHLGNLILILAMLLQFLFRVLSYLPELGFQQQRSSWFSWNPHKETKHNNFLQKTYLIKRSRLKT